MSQHEGRVSTWFGNQDDPSDRSYFHIDATDANTYPDWETQDFGDTRHIPGSNDNDIFDGGAGPDEITLSLEFDTREQYRAFRSRIKTTGTLQLLANFTSIEGAGYDGEIGTEVHEGGRDYERFAPVYLRRPQRVRHHIGGWTECEATFVLLREAAVIGGATGGDGGGFGEDGFGL